jgi:hypothetical protein
VSLDLLQQVKSFGYHCANEVHLVEFATVGKTEDGKIYHRLWDADEITALLKEHDLAKNEDTEEK